jgi:hypothetical protein
MNIFRGLLFVMILIIFLCSCEKEEKKENNLPKSYFDYNDFIKDGLVAYYPFNGNADDYSGNGIDGVVYNVNYSSDRFGKQDGACLFDGNDSYIKIENSDLLNGSTCSICFWYRADLSDTLEQSVISKADSSGYGFTIDLYNSDHFSNLGFLCKEKLYNSVTWFAFGPNFRVWSPEIEKEFKFAAIAFSENYFKDYFGGIEWTISPSSFFNANDYNLYIGMSLSNQYKNFTGELDDLLIYNRILSEDEIILLYNWNVQ